ncbi:MAG: hypothetical protein ACI857_001175 [Arenicella sp.]|jgi:hypothetical protein
MKSLIFAFGLIGIFGLTSCDPAAQHEKEISKIDSCLNVISDVEEKYNGIEFDSLKFMVDHVSMNEDTMKKYYNPDTLSMDIGVRMNDSKGIRKKLKGVDVREGEFKTEIEELNIQFTNLREDISTGVLTDDQITEYLARELFDLNILEVSFMEFYETQLLQKIYYYSSVPIIDELIVELKNEAQQE